LALATAFVPSFLIWRSAVLSLTFFVLFYTLEGPIHWSDQGFAHALGMAMLYLFFLAIASLIIVRLVIIFISGKFYSKVIIKPKNNWIKCFDIAILASIGCVVGLRLTILLLYLLSGTLGGIMLDIAIAISSCIFAIYLFCTFKKQYIIFFSTIFLTLAASATIGSFQTRNILKQGEEIANGQAWCLVASDKSEQISNIKQLGFFSLAKEKRNSSPHMELLIRNNDKVKLSHHWSIRQQSFIEQSYSESLYSSTCNPIKNFTTALQNNEIKTHLYAVGYNIYSIPKKYQPRAGTISLSINGDILFESNNIISKTNQRMEVVYNPYKKPYLPEYAKPLEMMPNLDEVNIDDLIKGKDSFVFTHTNDDGQQVLLECLRSNYEGHKCYVQVYNDLIAYNFYLPLNMVNKWEDAFLQVKELFNSFHMSLQDQ